MAPKTVLITGCSAGGIGSALVESFQKQGLRVFATARDVAKMEHLKELKNISTVQLDPISQISVETAFKTVEAETGGELDYLVNNAGQSVIMPTLDFKLDAVQAMYDINVFGLLRVTQVFAPLVITAKGTIVNIASISTECHTPWMGIYAGSKAAMTQISDTLRMELAPFSVKVVTVRTGAVKSNALADGPNFKLPPTSRYVSIEKEIAARARGEDGVSRMDASVYADRVVGDVLAGANRTIWRGSVASIDWVSLKGTGLDVMKKQSSSLN
ncbi:MAG: hypothetical protein M1821_000519 [Bathelium mastoideum]|nr:MAG: hypothetical protein M1821_000519 [Bathelium mastoideum]